MLREPRHVAAEERDAPALGSSVPVTQWKSVVLPAPFGPMSTRRSPCGTLSDTPSTARRPPKSLASP